MAYLSLSTTNLPDPVIDPAQNESPSDYFDIDTYTGTGATHERSNFTFQPDWLWIKRRSTADNHTSWDSMRGVNKVLKPNETGAEGTDATQISSFDADGFTLLSGGDVNASGQTFVAWCWKANGSGVSNTDGSITSQVSANTKAGFSVCTYTGNNTNGATFGHGLNSAPEMVIFKRRDSTGSWAVGHTDLGWDGIVILNSDNAFNTGYNTFNSVAPSSSVVTLGNTGDANEGTIVAYCFHSVEGYSKFGSYTGNGSADGPFVYTGFRPAFVMVKNASATGSWRLIDSSRSPENTSSQDATLYADLNLAEGNTSNIDFLSNGFKWISETDSDVNTSGNTYIYACFAENPFKYANAQ